MFFVLNLPADRKCASVAVVAQLSVDKKEKDERMIQAKIFSCNFNFFIPVYTTWKYENFPTKKFVIILLYYR